MVSVPDIPLAHEGEKNLHVMTVQIQHLIYSRPQAALELSLTQRGEVVQSWQIFYHSFYAAQQLPTELWATPGPPQGRLIPTAQTGFWRAQWIRRLIMYSTQWKEMAVCHPFIRSDTGLYVKSQLWASLTLFHNKKNENPL